MESRPPRSPLRPFYKQLDHLRVQIPDDSGLDMIERFLGMLITLAAFDLGQDRLQNFAAFRFLYERLLGAGVRVVASWLLRGRRLAAPSPRSPPHLAAIDQRKRGDRAGLVNQGRCSGRMGRRSTSLLLP
jgi:hypothetical protein